MRQQIQCHVCLRAEGGASALLPGFVKRGYWSHQLCLLCSRSLRRLCRALGTSHVGGSLRSCLPAEFLQDHCCTWPRDRLSFSHEVHPTHRVGLFSLRKFSPSFPCTEGSQLSIPGPLLLWLVIPQFCSSVLRETLGGGVSPPALCSPSVINEHSPTYHVLRDESLKHSSGTRLLHFCGKARSCPCPPAAFPTSWWVSSHTNNR